MTLALEPVLVTGAAGFIGGVLSRRLVEAGHRVTAVVGPQTDVWRLAQLAQSAEIATVDLRDARAVHELVRRTKPAVVFHLAAHGAYSWQTDLARMIDTNLKGLVNLVEAADAADVRAIVNAGSSSEYGFKGRAPSEDELPDPNSSYALTKASATLYCGFAARTRGQAITTLRLYSAYGPWEEPRRLVPAVVTHGLRHCLPPLADPTIARDFVFVDDIADAFVLAARAARPGAADVYNVGSGRQTTLRDLVEAARRVFGIEQQPAWGAYPARAWDTDTWVADADRVHRELGWIPGHSLEQGLAETARWLESHPELQLRYDRVHVVGSAR